MSETPTTPKKVHPDNEDLESLSKNDLITRIKDQEQYIKQLESKKPKLESEDDPEAGERLKTQQKEAARKENTLVHRLTIKEQELQDCLNQITEFKQAQTQGTAQLRSMLLDPAVNILFQRMSKETDEAQEKLKQTQNELSAWKFTPDSQTGKRLMARCQMLLQENEELGKTISSGRTAKLEGEIALQKTLVTEMKNNQSELDEFLGDLEEDVEGMQTMIYVLQQQLRESKDQISALEEENTQLRGGMPSDNYKTFAVKQRDKYESKVKSETTRNDDYESYKTQTDYPPMETGYYQNERTDSDLEAEYNYEGLYENEDKYQEELEAQQKAQDEAKQYEYEENGYRSYEDYDSQSQQEAMDTSEVEDSSKISTDYKVTTHTELSGKEQTSDGVHSTSSNTRESNGQQQTSNSLQTDTQHAVKMAKHESDSNGISSITIGNCQHSEDSSKECRVEDNNTVQVLEDRQRTTEKSDTDRTPENHTTCNQDQINMNTERTDNKVTETREKTPEKQRIPSPKVAADSPGKTNSKLTLVSSTIDEEESKTECSNSVTDRNPGKCSPKLLTQSENKDNSSTLTDKTSSNNKEKGAVREREPVLQQFFNGISSTGITSTVDDIEDL